MAEVIAVSKMNRLGNVRNPYQGTAKRVLCVCSAGLLRSPTTANVLHKEFGYNTRAAGINSEYALIIADDVLMDWADEIVFMEDVHYQAALHKFPFIEHKNCIVLNVPDNYAFMDQKLQNLILKKYEEVNGLA